MLQKDVQKLGDAQNLGLLKGEKTKQTKRNKKPHLNLSEMERSEIKRIRLSYQTSLRLRKMFGTVLQPPKGFRCYAVKCIYKQAEI